MKEVLDERKSDITNKYYELVDCFVTYEEEYEDEENLCKYDISVKDGGFDDEDCAEQQFYNGNLDVIRRLGDETTSMMAGGSPLPSNFHQEYDLRVTKHLDLYKKLYELEKPIAVLIDDEYEKRLYEFDSEDEYLSVCKRSLQGEFDDPITEYNTLFDGDVEDLDEVEQMFMSEEENGHLALIFVESGLLYCGGTDQTNSLYCLGSSKYSEDIDDLAGLVTASDLFIWKDEIDEEFS